MAEKRITTRLPPAGVMCIESPSCTLVTLPSTVSPEVVDVVEQDAVRAASADSKSHLLTMAARDLQSDCLYLSLLNTVYLAQRQ